MFNISRLFQTIDKQKLKFQTEDFSIEEDNSLGEQVVEALKSFKVSVEHIETEVGPVITNTYVKPKPGVKVTDVEALEDDLCIALGAENIKIQKAPEKKAITIEIPTTRRKKIPFGNILYSDTANKILPAALGIDTRGNPINIDIVDTPHLLIAGQTGSGKSVCLNAIITSLALNATPSDLQFLLIDPKRVEFSLYNDFPNLIGGHVINEIDEAMQSLQWLIQEMERRNLILAKSKCRKLSDFKQKLTTGNIADIPIDLADDIPYIVVVIDEYADLMMQCEKELTECIMKLAQKARNVGIHLILATQRPSTRILTGDIKANIPTRIALKVASSIDSKTIIDYGGAEKLLGKGDMILKDSNGSEQRIHGCFLEDCEIEKSVHYLKETFKNNIFRFNQLDIFNTPFEQYEKEISEHGALGKLANVCAKKISEAKNRNDLAEWLCEIKDMFVDELKIQMLPEYVNSIVNFRNNVFTQALIWAFYDYTDELGNRPLAEKIVQEAFDSEKSIEYKFIKKGLGESEIIDKVFSSTIVKKISETANSKNTAEKEQTCNWLQLLKDVIINWHNVEGRDELIFAHPKIFKDYIVEMAHEGRRDNNLLRAVYDNLELFKDLITEWGLYDCTFTQDEKAYPVIFENPQIFKDTIIDELKEGSYNAMITIAKNIPVFEDAFDVFENLDMDFIANKCPELFDKLIQLDNKYAKAVIYNNPEENIDQLGDWARNGDDKARESICDYVVSVYCSISGADPDVIISRLNNEKLCFEDWIIERAKRDYRLDFIAFLHPYLFIDDIISEAKEHNNYIAEYVIENELHTFDDKIAEMIKNGDEWARKIVENYFDSCNTNLIFNDDDNKEFHWNGLWNIKSCIVDLWEMNDDWSESLVNQYPYVFTELIIDWVKEDDGSRAKQIIYNNPKLFKKQILEWAMDDGDPCAKKIVYKNPEMFKELLLKWAIEDKDPNAEHSIRNNPQMFKNEVFSSPKAFFKTIVLWAIKNDDVDAREFICSNLELFKETRVVETQNNGEEKAEKKFCDLVIEWAIDGLPKAKKLIHDNPSIFFRKVSECANPPSECPSIFTDFIKEWALSDYKDAKYFALNNALSFKNVVASSANSDDETAEMAKNIIYDNPRAFRNLIDSWAKRGDEKAKKIIDELGSRKTISPEELWKETLRNKGLTDAQMSLRMFKYSPCYHSHMTKENMETEAERLIKSAKGRMN